MADGRRTSAKKEGKQPAVSNDYHFDSCDELDVITYYAKQARQQPRQQQKQQKASSPPFYEKDG